MSAIAGQPGSPRSWHRWLETEWSAVPVPKSGRPVGDKRRSGPECPKNRPAGVRAAVVAKQRVTTVERRDAGKWKCEGQKDGKANQRECPRGLAAPGGQAHGYAAGQPIAKPTGLAREARRAAPDRTSVV